MQRDAQRSRNRRAFIALALALVGVFFLSFHIGQYPIAPGELFTMFWRKLFGLAQTWTDQVEAVIFRIRLPRVAAAALIGAGLSCAGAAFQSLFRNPMVSPDVLGASSGAGFGAALGLYFAAGYLLTTLSAFAFGVVAVALAILVSRSARQNPTLGMVLAGIMVGTLFTSATSFLKLTADQQHALPAITYWLMGSLASIRLADLVFAAPPILAGLAALLLLRWKLNLIAAGEDEARSMGVHTGRVRFLAVTAATLTTAACVSVSGMIGWVGLVIPHLSRLLLRSYDNRVVLPASALMGASFLILVDTLARSISTQEIPLGILTSFVGAPFFLYLIIDRGNKL